MTLKQHSAKRYSSNIVLNLNLLLPFAIFLITLLTRKEKRNYRNPNFLTKDDHAMKLDRLLINSPVEYHSKLGQPRKNLERFEMDISLIKIFMSFLMVYCCQKSNLGEKTLSNKTQSGKHIKGGDHWKWNFQVVVNWI